jgi:glutamyl-tRNA(Gln) amidotransferase subunit E
VRPLKVTDARLKVIKENMPETIEERERRFVKELGLSADLARQITRSVNLDLFEQIVSCTEASPILIAVTLENTLVSLHRNKVPVESLQDRHFIDLFKFIAYKKVSSEAIPTVLTYLANNPEHSLEEVMLAANLTVASKNEIEETVQKIVRDREKFIRAQGEGVRWKSRWKDCEGSCNNRCQGNDWQLSF